MKSPLLAADSRICYRIKLLINIQAKFVNFNNMSYELIFEDTDYTYFNMTQFQYTRL